MPESTLTTFVAADGDNLAIQDWPLDPGTPLRGVVLLVHGLGEHAGRYDELARRLNSWGFAVRGYDQYGHGESGGVRGGLPSDNRLVEDLADVLSSTRKRMDAGLPLILLGHSMGGLVAARLVALGLARVDGLVLSSPAFDPGLNAIQQLLLAVLPSIAPNLRVRNGLDPTWISHDPKVVQAYRHDKLIHDRISGRLARFIADGGAATLGAAPLWQVPTLLLYAGADKLVSPRGSAAFAQAAPARVVTAHCFEGLYHEIFNELEREPVYARLQQWLDRWF
ncbi:alpha/beta hydrolase [Curvibacter sp. PAE-UM]|uniref:alpha/beta hydrolase n=1 Tax=Curvibacter sp. PAE-UM TaxID=1714344 RepID=UPI00070DFDC3|nr:alpha/beta hydrolase [Curvibacter sp. PAE-UM]KRH99613.1 alpha/beta hydrolase [Curvibacter sp. PAE-UM]